MKRVGLFFVAILISLFCSIHAFSADLYICSNAGSERVIEVVYATPGYSTPCEVTYTKGGDTETLWQAENEAGYCEAKAKALVDKQVGWGWSCSLSEK